MRRSASGSRTIERLCRNLARTAAVAALWLASGPAVEAQTLASLPGSGSLSRVEPTGTARPVSAWNSFCERNPAECAVDTSEPATISLTPRTWRILNAVNKQVNASLKPMTDMEHWGIVDQWDVPTDGYGDCEDYQILKRKILVEQHGLSRRALRMTVVIDEQGEGHAVLMVRTDEGDLVLDNKRPAIMPWHSTGYVFVKREGQDSRQWVSLGDRTSPTVTANR